MGPFGHFAIGLAAKPSTPAVPLAVLLLATMALDLLFFAFALLHVGDATAWSHGLFMSILWSAAAGLIVLPIFRSYRVSAVVGLMVLSHWVLDFISHPIPFPSFSWRSWQWDFGHPLPPDLPIFFGSSPKVGLGLYNSMSAVEATALELGMFILGSVIYANYRFKNGNERNT